MRHYGLVRPPVEAGFFKTDHHAQVSRDIRAAITGSRLIALTAVIGSGWRAGVVWHVEDVRKGR